MDVIVSIQHKLHNHQGHSAQNINYFLVSKSVHDFLNFSMIDLANLV